MNVSQIYRCNQKIFQNVVNNLFLNIYNGANISVLKAFTIELAQSTFMASPIHFLLILFFKAL